MREVTTERSARNFRQLVAAKPWSGNHSNLSSDVVERRRRNSGEAERRVNRDELESQGVGT